MSTTTSFANVGSAPAAEFHPSALTGHVIGGRVVIVDQQALVAQSLAMVLASANVTTYVTTDASLEAVLRQVRAFDPDLVLINASADEAVDLVRAVCRVGARVVAVTDGKDRIRVAQCLEAGAYAAVSTHEPVDRLLSAVRETVAGRRSVPNPADANLLGELQGFRRDRAALLARFAQLSTRESEVLEELMRGKAPAEIATSSYVSIATIRSQIKAILRKLEVNSQLAAVALAYQLGWSRNAFKANGGQARGHDLPTLPR